MDERIFAILFLGGFFIGFVTGRLLKWGSENNR